MYEILNTVNSPKDLKKLSPAQLETLASDVREALFNRLTKIGGHFGSNFGMVETEIALHYVFNSPEDRIVYDVSHQAYTHKMLTGRKSGYIDDAHFSEDSGYTNPEESNHDLFNIGHTSTSISLATGLARARDLKGGKENVIAIIGDGSLSGGMALEGLDVAGSEIKSNLIIILNDNEQSISENHGGIYNNLAELRRTNGTIQTNIFKAFGLDYVYEENANDIQAMIKVFEKLKDIDHPVVLHIHTQKGKGYKLAEDNREAWHWTMPFNRETGEYTVTFGENYTGNTGEYLLKKTKADKDVLLITPAMAVSFALPPAQRATLGNQYIDVGIAEEQAIAMAAGAAKRGAKPVVLTNMTFFQRVYDQVSHDVCINNLPVTFLSNYNSFDGLTDVSHLGIFGLSIFSNIPNLQVLAPTSNEEYLAMLDYAIDQNERPLMVLIPGGEMIHDPDFKELGNPLKFKKTIDGTKVAILALGDFYSKGEKLAKTLSEELGHNVTLVNPRNASTIDEELLEDIKKTHNVIVTIEDGVVDGGFGQKIASFYSASDVKVLTYGLKKKFYDRYDPSELLKELRITTEQMVEDVKKAI